MIRIRSNLYLSSVDVFPLSSPDIRAVVSLLSPPLSSYPEVRNLSRHHLYVPISDSPTDCLLTTLIDTLPFIHSHQADGVLIHCFHGISRSVATILAYLIWTEPSKLPGQHLQDIRAKHPTANPSTAFLRQLDAFYASTTPFPHHYVFPPQERCLHPLEARELLLLIKHSEATEFERLFLSNPMKNNVCAKCRICRQHLLPDNSIMNNCRQDMVSILPVKWMASSCGHRRGRLRCCCGVKIGRFDLDETCFEIVSSAVDWI